ncbi:MAG: hypothetical protein OEW21_08340 [Betaproteobacteria bacterium]|nr:hypothetical protein [Betaproteobacteria bacterium]
MKRSARTIAFRNRLPPSLYRPADERPHVGLVAGADPAKLATGAQGNVYVSTHVDILPPATRTSSK